MLVGNKIEEPVGQFPDKAVIWARITTVVREGIGAAGIQDNQLTAVSFQQNPWSCGNGRVIFEKAG